MEYDGMGHAVFKQSNVKCFSDQQRSKKNKIFGIFIASVTRIVHCVGLVGLVLLDRFVRKCQRALNIRIGTDRE